MLLYKFGEKDKGHTKPQEMSHKLQGKPGKFQDKKPPINTQGLFKGTSNAWKKNNSEGTN